MSADDITSSVNLSLFEKISRSCDAFWQSRWYFFFMFIISVIALVCGQVTLGICVLGLISAVFLFFCDDIMASITPFFMIFMIAAHGLDNIKTFGICVIPAAFVLAAFIFHMIHWPRKLVFGTLGWGRIAVALATLLGGIDAFFSRSLLQWYYIFGLGPMLLIFYLLFSQQLAEPRKYDLRDRCFTVFYSLGLMMIVVVFWGYIEILAVTHEPFRFMNFSYRNYAATVLLFTCPMPVYFMRKNKLHGLVIILFAAGLILTGSRSAIMFGTVEAVLSAIYIWRNKILSLKVLIPIFAVLIGICAFIFFGYELDWILSRVPNGDFVSKSDNRWLTIKSSIYDFFASPIWGTGLGRSLYTEKPASWVYGSLLFYEFAPSQVVGSMGIMGVIAYGIMLLGRAITLIRNWNYFNQIVAFSYLGILMISMTNPGIFCPFPNACLMVILFTVTERMDKDKIVIIKKK